MLPRVSSGQRASAIRVTLGERDDALQDLRVLRAQLLISDRCRHHVAGPRPGHHGGTMKQRCEQDGDARLHGTFDGR